MVDELLKIIGKTLQLGERVKRLNANSPLLGNLPELDSMAIVSLITALEEHFGFIIEDDEISADTFATVGSLSAFLEKKLSFGD